MERAPEVARVFLLPWRLPRRARLGGGGMGTPLQLRPLSMKLLLATSKYVPSWPLVIM